MHAAANRRIHAAFRAWLGTQLERQDPVGDFARDYTEDWASGCAAEEDLHTLSGIDTHLQLAHDAPDKVLEARDRAWRAWLATPEGAAELAREGG